MSLGPNNISSKLIDGVTIAPFIWLITGMLWLDKGDKIMVTVMAVAVLFSLIFRRPSWHSIKGNHWFWLIFSLSILAIIAYQTHGYSSREVRALLASSLFIAVVPRQNLTLKLFNAIVLLAGPSALGTIYFQMEIMHLNRLTMSINAIPMATLFAAFNLLAFVSFFAQRDKKLKVGFAISWVCSLVAVVMTDTRGIWLALIIGLIMASLYLLYRSQIKHKTGVLATGFITVAIAGALLYPSIQPRIKATLYEYNKITAGNLNTSIGLRLQMWQAVAIMAPEKLWLGYGDGHSQRLDELHQQGKVSHALHHFNPAHYHNQYIDNLIKNGVIGLVALLCLLVAPALLARNHAKFIFIMVISLIMLYGIAGLTDVPLNHGQTIFAYVLLLTLLFNLEGSHFQQGESCAQGHQV